MLIDLSDVERTTFDPIVYGPHRWEFTSDDLPAGPCMVLAALFRQWYAGFDAAAAAGVDADPTTYRELAAFETKLPDLLAQIMEPKYPEWTAERIRGELPKAARAELATTFFTFWLSAPDSFSQSRQRLEQLTNPVSAAPPTAPSASVRRPKRAPAVSS